MGLAPPSPADPRASCQLRAAASPRGGTPPPVLQVCRPGTAPQPFAPRRCGPAVLSRCPPTGPSRPTVPIPACPEGAVPPSRTGAADWVEYANTALTSGGSGPESRNRAAPARGAYTAAAAPAPSRRPAGECVPRGRARSAAAPQGVPRCPSAVRGPGALPLCGERPWGHSAVRSAGDAALPASSALGERSSLRPPESRSVGKKRGRFLPWGRGGPLPALGCGRAAPPRTEAGDADVRGAERPAAVASGDGASPDGLWVALWGRSAPSGPRVERPGSGEGTRAAFGICVVLSPRRSGAVRTGADPGRAVLSKTLSCVGNEWFCGVAARSASEPPRSNTALSGSGVSSWPFVPAGLMFPSVSLRER